QPIAKSADGQMCNRGESPTVMGVDDEACDLVRLVRNDRLVKKCGEGQIRESMLRRDLFLAGLSRNAGQLVAAARRRGLGEERPEIAERITAISDRRAVHDCPCEGWMRHIRAADPSGRARRLTDPDDTSMCCSDTTELWTIVPVRSKSFHLNF